MRYCLQANEEERVELDHPTVADMVQWLMTQPQDAPFRIEDPDTGWTCVVIAAYRTKDGKVFLSSDYGDMEHA
jgi:hypothetical protein